MSSPIIVRLVKENPRREGTEGWKAWNLLHKGMTYDKYLAAGGRRDHLAWDLNKGNVKLVLDGKRVSMPAGVKHVFTKGSAPTPRGIDDSKVKVLHSSPRWKAEYRTKPALVNVKGVGTLRWHENLPTVWVSPKGRRYVDALPTEKADLVLLVGTKEFWGSDGPHKRRLKRFKDSAVARHEKRQRKETSKAVERHKAKQADKKAKKQKHLPPALKRGKRHGKRRRGAS